MRLPDHAHADRPWRIHEITGDFALEDVWALPTPGGPDDFALLVGRFADARLDAQPPRAAGSALGHPGAARRAGLGPPGDRARRPGAEPAHRLPADLRDGDPGPEFTDLPFRSDLPHRRRVGGRDGQPDGARRPPPRLGGRRRRPRLPRPDGGAGQAERPCSAALLHGRHRPVAALARLPAADGRTSGRGWTAAQHA